MIYRSQDMIDAQSHYDNLDEYHDVMTDRQIKLIELKELAYYLNERLLCDCGGIGCEGCTRSHYGNQTAKYRQLSETDRDLVDEFIAKLR